jgi:hypothetical protein
MALQRLSAELKLVVVVLALGALAGAGGAWLIGRDFEERVEEVGATLLAGANEAFQAQQAAEVGKLGAALDALMASRELREAFLRRDRPGLQALAGPVLEVLRDRDHISHWYFHEPGPDLSVFLRVHRPELFGDATNRITLRRAADTGEMGAGLELGRTAFALRVVRPWFANGRLIGYMELAEEVDHFLTAMRSRTGDEYGLLVQKRFLDEKGWAAVLGPRANTWNARPDVVVVDATGFTEGLAGYDGDVERLPETGRFLGEVLRAGHASIHGAFPVADAAGRRVAALYVVHDFTAHHQAVHGGRRQALVVLLLLALGVAATTALLLRLWVFRRLAAVRRRLEQRLGGLAPRGAPGGFASHDDLGRLEALFDRALGEPQAGPDAPARTPPSAPPGPGAPDR